MAGTDGEFPAAVQERGIIDDIKIIRYNRIVTGQKWADKR
jgi:hypothetical protein